MMTKVVINFTSLNMGCLQLSILKDLHPKRSLLDDLKSISNYIPIDKRRAGIYRYSFQGQEADNEISGSPPLCEVCSIEHEHRGLQIILKQDVEYKITHSFCL